MIRLRLKLICRLYNPGLLRLRHLFKLYPRTVICYSGLLNPIDVTLRLLFLVGAFADHDTGKRHNREWVIPLRALSGLPDMDTSGSISNVRAGEGVEKSFEPLKVRILRVS
jgi:hypothetical protein